MRNAQKVNFDHPQSIDFDLLIDHLKKLRAGENVEQPIYSFKAHNRTDKTKTIKSKKSDDRRRNFIA